MELIFYTTHCPKCKVLKTKLDKMGLSYEINEDIDEMLSLGIQAAPALKVNNELMDFGRAINFLKEIDNAN